MTPTKRTSGCLITSCSLVLCLLFAISACDEAPVVAPDTEPNVASNELSDDLVEGQLSKGKPPGKGNDSGVQLGSGDDVWPGVGGDNSGDDEVHGGDGDDEISGGPGDDNLYGESGNDILYGNEGADWLEGGDGIDTLYGGDGDDRLRAGGSGDDYFDGGSGFDRVWFMTLDQVDVTFGEPGQQASYSGSFSSGSRKNATTVSVAGVLFNVEHVDGSPGDDVMHGNSLNNHFTGRGGIDTLYGYGGDDSLIGNLTWGDAGDKYFDGGDGNDYFMPLYGDDYVIGGLGDDRLLTREGHGHDTIEDFEGAGAVGGDVIFIYNSNVCFDDLTITTVDADGDGGVDDTLIEFGTRKNDASVTLLDVTGVWPDDFDFELDNNSYSGCL